MRNCAKVIVVSKPITQNLLHSSFTAFAVLFLLFIAVLMVSFAFELSSEASEILSFTLMFGYLGLRRRNIRNSAVDTDDFEDDDEGFYEPNPGQNHYPQGVQA
jgi:hypothetical protein